MAKEKESREKKISSISNVSKALTEAQLDRQREKEAVRKQETEFKHQSEEAERRSLVKKMMQDVKENKSSFNSSSAKVLNNYQGYYNYKHTLFHVF